MSSTFHGRTIYIDVGVDDLGVAEVHRRPAEHPTANCNHGLMPQRDTMKRSGLPGDGMLVMVVNALASAVTTRDRNACLVGVVDGRVIPQGDG